MSVKWTPSEIHVKATPLIFYLKFTSGEIFDSKKTFCSQLIDRSTPSTTGWVGYSIPPPILTTGSMGGTLEPHSAPPTVWQGPPTLVSIGTTCPLRRGRRNVRLRNILMCVNIEMDYTNPEPTGSIGYI